MWILPLYSANEAAEVLGNYNLFGITERISSSLGALAQNTAVTVRLRFLSFLAEDSCKNVHHLLAYSFSSGFEILIEHRGKG